MTTTTRICLDMLTSARARREEYVGPWLPEPVVDTAALAPDSRTELAEDMSDGPTDRPRIARIWRGRTKRERADEVRSLQLRGRHQTADPKGSGRSMPPRRPRDGDRVRHDIGTGRASRRCRASPAAIQHASIICHEIPSSSSSCPKVFRFSRSARLTGIPAAACARGQIPHNGGATTARKRPVLLETFGKPRVVVHPTRFDTFDRPEWKSVTICAPSAPNAPRPSRNWPGHRTSSKSCLLTPTVKNRGPSGVG